MPIVAAIKQFHRDLQARAARHFREQEIVRVMSTSHMQELSVTPGEQWGMVKSRQAHEIQAVRDGKFDVVDRRTWQFPYLPEALHRLNQPILKNTPYNLRRFSETPIPRRAINLLKNAVLGLDWVVEAVPELENEGNPKEREKRIRIVTDCLKRPNNVDSFRTFSEAVLEDVIIGGYGCIEPRMTPYYKRPFKAWVVDGSCVSADTEVLTKRGWVFWPDVRDDDEFATQNPKTRKLEWQKSIRLHRQKYSGDLLRFKAYSHDILVTPNHRMWGKRIVGYNHCAIRSPLEFVEAQNVPLGKRAGCYLFNIPTTSRWEGRLPSTAKNGKITLTLMDGVKVTSYPGVKGWQARPDREVPYTVDIKDWLAFLGIYIAEGSCSGVQQSIRGRHKSVPAYIPAIAAAADLSYSDTKRLYRVSIAQAKTSRHHKAIGDLLSRLPWQFVETQDGFHCVNKGLHHYLFPYGNKYVKHIPDWVKDLPPEFLSVFVKWAVMGDGYERGGNRTYVTTSKKLADDMQEVFQKLGKTSTIATRPAGTTHVNGKEFKTAPCHFVCEGKKKWHGIGKRSLVPYDDYVYCASVPNETLYMRRNGMPFWLGNTIRQYADWSESMTDRPKWAQMTGLKGERGIVAFLADELIYIRDNVRSSTPFGLGKLEVGFNCYSADTEVLTRRGWLLWPEVHADDVLATRNPKTGLFAWQLPLRLHKARYTGEMIHFLSQSTNVLVTPNHRMFCRRAERDRSWRKRGDNSIKFGPFEFLTAETISVPNKQFKAWSEFQVPARSIWRGDKLARYVRLTCEGGKRGKKPDSYYVRTKDWISFLGIYVAEGSAAGTMFKRRKHVYIGDIAASAETPVPQRQYQVHVSQSKDSRYYNEIRTLLHRMPFQWTETAHGFYCVSKALHSALFPLGNKYEKYVPQLVKDAPPQAIRSFIEWACKGDGCVRPNGLLTYTTTSKQLADDMQELFQKSGSSASIFKEIRKPCALPDGRWCENPQPMYFVLEQSTEFDGIGKAKRVPYDGFVYCATVPNETLMVRRGGKALWCGNTVNAFLGAQDMSSKAGSDQVHKTFMWWEQPQNQAHIQTVRRHIQNELEGQAKISIIAGMKKPEIVPVEAVKPDDLLLDWQEFLIRIIANAFDISPFSLGLEKDVNRNTGLIMALSDFRGAVVPLANRFQESLTRDLIQGFLGWKDLQFKFQGLDDPDALTKVQIDQRKYQMNAVTPDEMRESDGQPPLPGGWGNLTFGQMQILIQEAMALSRAQMGGGAGGAGGGASGGSSGGAGMGMPGTGGASGGSGAITPGNAGAGGMRGFQGSLIGSGEFSTDDIQQMSPEEVQYFQEVGMLPDTNNLAQQMDMQKPGILDQLGDELKEFFENAEETEKENEEKPEKVSKADERSQQQRYQESLRKPTVIEQYLNDRYRGWQRFDSKNLPPGEQDMTKVQGGKRGKYPRSGGERGDYK